MVVRLHPGQSRRLSSCLDKEDASDASTTVTRRTWLEVENEKTSQSVCGLEISFQAPPQAIDIRLLNSHGETISATSQDYVGAEPTAKSEKSETNSISSETINLEINKTRQ
jgi:hypothetical protein